MHRPRVLAVLFLVAASQALAQPAPADPGRPRQEAAARRLFQRFVEDAVIAPGGWVEAQYHYENLVASSRHFVGPLIAFKVIDDLEAGLRFGYVNVRSDAGPDGSGVSDIDLFLKYRLPGGGRGRVALGVLYKAPTADETQGIGTGEPDFEIFTAYRANLEAVTLVASVGARFNGEPQGTSSTEDTFLLGAGLILPATPALAFVVEGTYETERFEGLGSDARLTVGVQAWGAGRRGGLRGAVAIPLNDGAPDVEVFAGAYIAY
jgi:hypothetical protein